MGDHGQTLGGRRRRVSQEVGYLQELIVIRDTDHAILGQGGVVEGVQAGERGGMRLGGLGSQLRSPDLDEDDGFASLGRQLGHRHELAGVFESLDKTGDHLCAIVIQQVAHEIREIQVGLVSRGDDVAEPDTAVDRPGQERSEGRRPALADQTHRSCEALGAPGRGADPDVIFQVG